METAQALCARLREKGYAITPQRQEPSSGIARRGLLLSRGGTARGCSVAAPGRLAGYGLQDPERTDQHGRDPRAEFPGQCVPLTPKCRSTTTSKCSRCGRLEDVDLVFDTSSCPSSSQGGFRIDRHEGGFSTAFAPPARSNPLTTHKARPGGCRPRPPPIQNDCR